MKNYRNKEVKLVHIETGVEFKKGDKVTTFRGEEAIIRDLYPPHKSSASGRVNGYYASVYNLKYVEVE